MNIYEYTIYGKDTLGDALYLIAAKTVRDAELIGQHVFNNDVKPYGVKHSSFYTERMVDAINSAEGYFTSSKRDSFVHLSVRTIKLKQFGI